ncbi:type 2 periplasmic-binding domain-containing protein [Chitinimonas naiadis]
MKKLPLVLALLLLPSFALADGLADILKRGKMTVGVNVGVVPFGVRNANGSISGYDVDFALAIAKELGVKVEVVSVEPFERVKQLKLHKVDMLIANMGKTPEAERDMDFSTGYFVTSQKVLAKKGRYKQLASLKNATIGVSRGTSSETEVRKQLHAANIVPFDSLQEAATYLAQDKLDAISTGEVLLLGIQKKLPNPAKYEITDIVLATTVYGIGVNKGEKALLSKVNATLGQLEKSGEAARIYNRWFGPNTATPLVRMFTIQY